MSDSDESESFEDAPVVDESSVESGIIDAAIPGSPESVRSSVPGMNIIQANEDTRSTSSQMAPISTLNTHTSHSRQHSVSYSRDSCHQFGTREEVEKMVAQNPGMNNKQKQEFIELQENLGMYPKDKVKKEKEKEKDEPDEKPDEVTYTNLDTGTEVNNDDIGHMDIWTMDRIKERAAQNAKYAPKRVKVRRPGLDSGFEHVIQVQAFEAHKGSCIRVAKFNKRGNFLATAGSDEVLKLWTVCGSSIDKQGWKNKDSKQPPPDGIVINQDPYRVYSGHKRDIFDLDWSDHDFIVTAGLDKTVILWHHSKEGPLRVFQHGEILTGVRFHPKQNASQFISCTINSRVSLWDSKQKRILSYVEVGNNIRDVCTALTVSPNGKMVAVGLDNGQVYFYEITANEMKYFTATECYTKAKKAQKVTGIVYDEIDKNDEQGHGAKTVIVSTNDNKIRVFDTQTYQMIAKYTGTHNEKGLQISAHCNSDYLICGSDNESCRIWKMGHREQRYTKGLFRSRNYFKCEKHLSWTVSPGCAVTVTRFAPSILDSKDKHRGTMEYVCRWHEESLKEKRKIEDVIIAGTENGELFVYLNLRPDDPMVLKL